MTRAEEVAMKAYPKEIQVAYGPLPGADGPCEFDDNLPYRIGYQEGYEQAEKDLASAFEFPFYVPDDDGFIVFTPMDNQTIRRELKLKKGERVIISIRKEHEKE